MTAWACARDLRMTVRTKKAEVTENLLYGCVAWSPNKSHYSKTTYGIGLPPLPDPPMPQLAGEGGATITPTRLSRQAPTAVRQRCADDGW